ncbi:MAG: FprA family A-type flavoprotein [Anaerolineae bacterium]|jgi:flavorubredoxin|nr:FprA family A-type flavoprotein [Anaerolineae bacterium]
MPAIEVKPGIYWIGVNDRTTDLFEGLWPIDREGVSYNAYLIDDDKKVLIDMSRDFKADELLDQIAHLVDPLALDYIVVNHMEPDHTGVLRTLRRVAPNATILGTQKAVEFMDAFYHITQGVRAVSDGEVLELGSHTLQFVETPFVHWPETMMTYEVKQRVLFPCDGFGGYGALQGAIFDDQYDDLSFYEREALRYYVNIVALYPKPVLKAIGKLANVPVDVIAPSHGLIWRKDPGRIVALYKKWAEAAGGPGELGVTLLYGTMYGMTERMVEAVAEGVAKAGVPIDVFDVSHVHVSRILPSVYTHAGVLIGAPTYEGGLFPTMVNALHAVEHKRIFNRKAAYFGSYGWSGGAERDFKKLAEELRWECQESFAFRGGSDLEGLDRGVEFGYQFAQSLKAG